MGAHYIDWTLRVDEGGEFVELACFAAYDELLIGRKSRIFGLRGVSLLTEASRLACHIVARSGATRVDYQELMDAFESDRATFDGMLLGASPSESGDAPRGK
jgi:hypothetical protein